MVRRKSIAIFLILFLQLSANCNSAPLSTRSRWIVDEATGQRVKLKCVNWVSHLQPMIAEGLDKKPLSVIVGNISQSGFNCVRFSWATYMFTRHEYYGLTVSQSLDKYNLVAAKAGVDEHNKWILKMKIKEAHEAVVNELGRQRLMVVLDNAISQPEWCCDGKDSNGFFGDSNFDPTEWFNGLRDVAKRYKGNAAVIGMSLRNELRGSRQNLPDYYKFMQAGANTVHQESPHFLVIVSGLHSDINLSFLKTKPLSLNVNNKLVFEAHWYTFGISPGTWTRRTNFVCNYITQAARNNYLFLINGDNPFPLFLSEFGIDQSGENEADNRYINCLLAEVAGKDIEWSLWAFQGSYMLRQGKVNADEAYGVSDFNWDRPRNRRFLRKLELIRHINQDPKSKKPSRYIMFHPQSGKCVRIGEADHTLLDNCKYASRWDQDGSRIKLAGTQQCLTANRDGAVASVTKDCSSGWQFASSSGLHLAVQIEQGKYLCLEKNAYGPKVITKKCRCVDDKLADLNTCDENPQVQWFKLVPTNV
ncbi:Cellulase (glycosyl hydrolase family 5) protein [Striga hermonthica]|uniref:Cellulase (Glycosyl hydrolase family 5) protein n=1 Tax=Striga hermonthica TaxID=68872 RepID=A0A9N7RA90_STRHE|nr:Cellulase (glycosyl hydrolase family 5) protein [Striga hermonthica]